MSTVPRLLAAIDCGTNTVLLTIARREPDGALTPVLERAEITRLGEGLARTGLINEAALARTLDVFREYAALIAEQGCERVLAVGTEALRRASNGAAAVAGFDEMLRPVRGALEIITGRREAELCFRAVAGSFPSLRGLRTVVDIGGGSTELVVGDREIESVISLPIGSVVLTERYLSGDPPTRAERSALQEAIDEALAQAPPCRGAVVGVAGTVTTYAAISLGLSDYDATRVHGLSLSRAALDRDVERLAGMKLEDRRRMPGLQPKRADVVYAGGVILSSVLTRAGQDACLVSDRGLRWGLLHEAAAS